FMRGVGPGLAPHGYVFTEAHDGAQALSAIREDVFSASNDWGMSGASAPAR
ncbi:hypothetical protein HK404_36290, partial [Myxococcus xanthus]|nr:hypothetical protein [Myxococcus xanthus]